jgi:hypothetical protein
VRVDLLSGPGGRLKPSPGRIFIIAPSHTFLALADAINAAFARWDLLHLHEFELAGGRRIGVADPEPFEGDEPIEDQAAVRVADAVGPGDEFMFVFDFGDHWEHRCRVLTDKVDPREAWGTGRLPKQPVAVWGWDRSRPVRARELRRRRGMSRSAVSPYSRRRHRRARGRQLGAVDVRP